MNAGWLSHRVWLDEPQTKAPVKLGCIKIIQSEIKMWLEKCQRKRSQVWDLMTRQSHEEILEK